MKKISLLSTLAILLLIGFSCIPARQFEDMKASKEKCEQESSQFKSESQTLKTQNTELQSNIETLTKQFNGLKNDTTVIGTSLRRMTVNYDQLNKIYELLLQKYEQLLAGNVVETQKITSKLMLTQEDLQKKEDELKRLQSDLNEKEKNLLLIDKDLKTAQTALEIKNKKLIELENILKRQDSVVLALRKKVSDALTGFEGKGLTVNTKNGKVYVQLEESLLFASGSWEVAIKGVDALKNLANVLNTNPDINILVEGHTDNVPYKGAGQIKDNWDLSVVRATSIVKILLNNKVDPKRLMAAGRGEFFPIDNTDTKEGRAKNRRTEIILTPKLDELLQIIESN
ncbi:MAG: OmpA family protein [Bacteroidota bacterium]